MLALIFINIGFMNGSEEFLLKSNHFYHRSENFAWWDDAGPRPRAQPPPRPHTWPRQQGDAPLPLVGVQAVKHRAGQVVGDCEASRVRRRGHGVPVAVVASVPGLAAAPHIMTRPPPGLRPLSAALVPHHLTVGAPPNIPRLEHDSSRLRMKLVLTEPSVASDA